MADMSGGCRGRRANPVSAPPLPLVVTSAEPGERAEEERACDVWLLCCFTYASLGLGSTVLEPPADVAGEVVVAVTA